MKILKFLVGGVLLMVLIGQIKSFMNEDSGDRFMTEHEKTMKQDKKNNRNAALGALGIVGAIGAGIYWLSKRNQKRK